VRARGFSPFGRPDQRPGAWGGPGGAGPRRRAPRRTRGAGGAWSDPLLFAPAGAPRRALWAERGGRPWRGAAASALGLGGLWAAVELVRGAAGADLAPWAVAVRALASLLGACIAAAALAGARRAAGDGPAADVADGRAARWLARRGPAVAAALLLAWSWRPFGPVGSPADAVAKLGGGALVPLASQAELYTLNSVADVAVGFLLYVPVGAWLAGRGAGRVRALWPGFALAGSRRRGRRSSPRARWT
jgi:hypothetical protein